MCKSMNVLAVLVSLWCLVSGNLNDTDAQATVISDCPHQPLTPFYQTLDCTPVKENGAECPTSYNCSKFEERARGSCHTGSKSFNVSESVGDSPNHCQVACFCSQNHGSNESRPHIVCAHVDCPWSSLDSGCSYKYTSDKCCPSVQCEEKSSVTEKVTCAFENKTIKDGETFSPSSNPCTICTCSEGFKGLVEEPFCKQENCSAQIHYNSGQQLNDGCAPIFYGTSRCCPIGWRCPEKKTDVVLKAITKSNSKTEETCKFGQLILHSGDTLNTTSTNGNLETCSCDLPPVLTCIQPEHKDI